MVLFVNLFHSELQKELQARILKEYKPVLRQVEKLRERFSQRYTRHSRSLQDRRAKDRFLLTKSVKDSLGLVHAAEEKSAALFQKDIKAWNSSLLDKIELGKAVFLGTHIPDLPQSAATVRSPVKAGTSGKGGASSAANSIGGSFSEVETFSQIVVPDALKAYLTAKVPSSSNLSGLDLHISTAGTGAPRSSAGMSSEDALSALMGYFNLSSHSSQTAKTD